MLRRARRAADLTAVNELEARCWLDGPLGLPGRVGGMARTLFLNMNAQALAGQGGAQPVQPPAAWDRLGELLMPTLIGYGDLDFPHIQDRCRVMGAAIGGAKLAVWPGTAHLPSLEAPSQVNADLLAFLASVRP
jgi:pimeloyl-ACP methyl ester carboxylesterase